MSAFEIFHWFYTCPPRSRVKSEIFDSRLDSNYSRVKQERRHRQRSRHRDVTLHLAMLYVFVCQTSTETEL